MQALEERVINWAEKQPDVRALLLVGSRARPFPPAADLYSDLDFEIYTTSPDSYRDAPDWLDTLGNVWV